jgi:anti-sigma factor RsiW
MTCAEFRPYLEAFVDQELSPERSIDVERHLLRCQECAAEAALTRSLCRATRTSVVGVAMCPEFRARLCCLLSEERERQESNRSGPLPWRVILPLAAAATMALFFGTGSEHAPALTSMADLSMQNNVVDFLVQHHASGRQSELNERTDVSSLEPQLGFPVRAPNLESYGVRFVGANMVPLDRARVAMLHYSLGGRRITLYMYDPMKLPLRGQVALQPRAVRDRAVFVGNRSGYAIAACEQHGVGYAVTSELSGDETAELVAAIDR